MVKLLLILLLCLPITEVHARTKYAIHNDFKAACRITAPMGRGTLGIGNLFLGAMSKGMQSGNKLKIEQHCTTSSYDNKKIRMWVITPKVTRVNPMPAILFLHGGGFVFKGAPYHYDLAKEYAQRTGSVVVMVDYRTAHNNPYGVPLCDCQDVWMWITTNADVLGIDTSKTAIVGDSAGGFLAIKTTLWAVGKSAVKPAKMMLIYPVVDCSMRTLSMKTFVDTPVWNSQLNSKMWGYYLKDNTEQSLLDLAIRTLQTLPPTYIESAEYDCLRDEAEIFAEKLRQAGVYTLYITTHGTMHGFDMDPKSHITQTQIDLRSKWLQWEVRDDLAL